jgi:hypothetical protein
VATVGLASLAVKLYRKRPYGEPEPNRADQFAGMLLAGAKAAVMAAFLVGALDKYALIWIKQTNWANDLSKESLALGWQDQYHPSEKIWAAAPVQHYVAHVQQMGIASPHSDSKPTLDIELPPVQTAETHPPRLDLPTREPLDPSSADFTKKFADEVDRISHP